MSAVYKWLPVIDKDYCTGCAKCVRACDHECLDMVWEFATLTRPHDCGSEGACMEACPSDVITMAWVEVDSSFDREQGRWCDGPHPAPPAPKGWFARLLGIGGGEDCDADR